MKYFLFLFFTVSINAQQSIPVIEINKSLPEVDLKLSDICSDISYTKLEFDSKHPVDQTGVPDVTDKYIFFRSRQKILRYTRDGKTVQMIGSIGNGPEEYLPGSSFVFDYQLNRLYIQINYTQRVLIYDGDKNKYLNSFQIEDTEGQFSIANNGRLLQLGNTRRRYSPRYYAWQLLKSDGKIVYRKENTSFTKTRTNHRWEGNIAPSAITWKNSDNLFCSIQEIGSDTIFNISENLQTTPRFVIRSSVQTKGENAVNFLSESSRYLFWRLDDDVQKKSFSGVYDKILKKPFIYSQNKYSDYRDDNKKKSIGIKNDIDGGLPVRAIMSNRSGSYCHFFVQPSDLIEHINSAKFRNAILKDPSKKKALIDFVKTLQEDDNPVLVTLKIK